MYRAEKKTWKVQNGFLKYWKTQKAGKDDTVAQFLFYQKK